MVKPIKGSWFEFQHHAAVEGPYWNPACAGFTAQQWDMKVREQAELGMEYLVLMAVALDGKAFFPTDIQPPHDMACQDPLEAVLAAADKYGMKFFIGNDFWGDWTRPTILTDPDVWDRRMQSMTELVEKYGRHKSFHGWYWANEACVEPLFHEEFVTYINRCSAEAHRLTPGAPTMIAPYGTRLVKPDDKYIRQLERMDVDIMAYQDEIGVQKSRVDETAAFYEGLRKAHDRAGRSRLWADVEVFEFEGKVYHSALLPAEFCRIEKQLQAVSPFVDVILIYQYLGMMSKPDSPAYAGHQNAARLYEDYRAWLAKNHPDMSKV